LRVILESRTKVEDRTVFQPSAGGSVKPGARLNEIYEIEKLIAQGGMGEVYRGFNIQTGHQVAIKMIRPEYSNDPEIFNLFRREALTLHNLTHEAIVRYFVISVDPDLGRAYLAMEFVDGPSLTKRLAAGALPLDEVKVLQRRLASALETAHQHGIIHRDISPDNIILPDGDVGRAKIVDFGIARSVHRTEATIIGSRFAGKYNFASPEQFGLGEVTFKSDIYSLGLVLAAALRGRPIDMTGAEVVAIAKRSVVPDLSDIDSAIRPLIRAMLQPLPPNRLPSMAAVAAWEGSRRPGLVLPRAANKAKAVHEPAGGRTPAFLGAVIALLSIGGGAYAFRDDLARWGGSVIGPTAPLNPAKLPPSSESVARTQLPPLGPPEPKPAEKMSAPTASPSPMRAPVEAPPTPSAAEALGENAPPETQSRPEPTKKPHVPNADELAPAFPPVPAPTVSPLQPPVAAQPPGPSPLPAAASQPSVTSQPTTAQKFARAASPTPAPPGPFDVGTLTPQGERELKAKDVFKECPECPEMVVAPSGAFAMGSSKTDVETGFAAANESPQHRVVISRRFALSRAEVTRDEFEAFVAASQYSIGNRCYTLEDADPQERADRSFRNPGFAQTGGHPAVCVNWLDAMAYAEWLSRTTGKTYRLPNEAEYEYAARAGSEARYGFADDASDLCKFVNGADQSKKLGDLPTKQDAMKCADGYANTAPVGVFPANAFGLFDLQGNVWEWTEDCYREDYRTASSDGSAPATGLCVARTVRGGSWSSPASFLRPAVRAKAIINNRYDDVGFRVARDLGQ
jgi:serine/threonine-protein kinase